MFIRKAISYFEDSYDFKRNTQMFINTLLSLLVHFTYIAELKATSDYSLRNHLQVP